jgi:hypothetical protein
MVNIPEKNSVSYQVLQILHFVNGYDTYGAQVKKLYIFVSEEGLLRLGPVS